MAVNTLNVKDRKITELIPAEYNPRHLSAEAQEHLAASLKRFGAVDPAIINTHPDRKNIIVGGHQRIKVAQSLGWDTFPCVELSLDRDQERELNIRLNKNTGSWDWDALSNYFEAEELTEWGFTEWGFSEEEEAEAQEDDYAIPDEVQTDIVLGDLIEIGHHRLLCGDSTDSETVVKLMNGEKADMVFTDPPYGVNIKGGKNNTTISGDITQTAIPFSFDLACNVATKDDARLYFCGGEGNIGLYGKLFEKFCRQLPRHLIWVKNGFVMKPNGYHNQYEIIFHGYKPKGGGLKNWYGGRTEHEASDVWRINRDASSTYEHPTQKPVALPERAIKNSCPKNGLVYEPFTGSGSTMVACHQLNRKCYGMELDPKYCQVIIDRMQNSFPDLPVTINGKPYKKAEA